MMNFSVLMSIYKKENPVWFMAAVDSVMNQTFRPNEIVIVQDGKLTEELYNACAVLAAKYSEIKYYVLKKNCGLGVALCYGVKACKNELIARMDTDDIAVVNRFEIQIKKFMEYPNLAICGGSIAEFECNPADVVSKRCMPCSNKEIVNFSKERNPFNHMTVMFKKSAVIAVGNYQEFPLMEDYYLWYRMIRLQYFVCNVNDVLVNVRVGNGMYDRRGGINYFLNEKKLYDIMRNDGFINIRQYAVVLLTRLLVRVSPVCIRKRIYKFILRG